MGAVLLRNITVSGSLSDVLVSKGRFERIEPAGSSSLWELAGDIEIMDCTGKVAVPGFINMHTHAAMSLMRGIGEDIVFQDWIDRIWKVEESIDEEYVYLATKVACVEMIKTGTTTFNDHYWHFEAGRKAASELGLRIAGGYVIMDRSDPEAAARMREECTEQTERAIAAASDGAVPQLALHAIYSVSEEMILWASEFARNHGIRLHIHLSETRKEVEDCKAAHGGMTPVEYLDSLGVLGPDLIAAHTLWLTPHDLELLGSRGVNCVHNINSNTKLSSGYRFLYNELRDAGANVCLGTDGCASSNNLDMLEVMKTSAIFQKAWRDDPSSLPLPELLDMATVNGAKALGIDTGRIEEGAVADLIIVDTDNSFFLSPAPFLANLVYSAHSDCIDSVICGGRFLMRHREVPGERQILEEARKAISKLSI